MAPGFLFKPDDNVLAYHGPLIYEASVRESVAKDAPDAKGTSSKIKLYLIHYQGWNPHWDEWVPESRLLKHTDANLALQKERIKEFQRAHKRKQKSEAAAGAGGKKAKVEGKAPGEKGEKGDEWLCADIKEQLRLPHGMRLKIIEDWERITREHKLVPLPLSATPTVSVILEEFLAAKARRSSHERLYGEVCDGVTTYFNQALGTILLYKYERRQFREIKEENKALTPAQIYGAEHLLRLFVKLPELLAQCRMQREHMTVLLAKLMELLKFLQSNKAKYFVQEYEAATDDYLAWFANE